MDVEFLVVHGQPRGKTLHFPPGDVLIGHGPECHIRPNSAWVSRQHCLLRVTTDGALVRDLGSDAGTLVNGHLVVGECRLSVGDQVQVGPVALEVRQRV